jgi:phage terminase large subunit-like protein
MRRPPEWNQAIALAKKAKWDPAWICDMQDVRAVLDGCWFELAAADHVVKFFLKYLRHSKGQWAGEPFTLLPWEDDALRRLFGWKRADGTRRFRRGGIWVPKKNGKSTIAAGIELYLLVGDNEPGAEVYSAANDRGQAGIIYTEAANMVRKSPDLKKRLQPVDSRKTIAYPGMAGFLQAMSADVPTKEGINAHGVINDELHAQKSRALWDTLVYAGAARRQPLNLSISTAGIYDHTSIGWEQYQYAKGVLEAGEVGDAGIKDWAFFALVFEATADDDWSSPETWKKANPSFGITIDPDTFAEEFREAQQFPAKQNSFRRYRLNQWVQQATRWIPMDVWAGNNVHAIDHVALAGLTCDAGLDLGSVSDITALAYLFECPDDPHAIDVVMRFWVPEASLSNQKNKNRDLYQQWVNDGYLETTPGNVTDYDFIKAAVIEDAQRFTLRSIAIDRLFQGQQLSLQLAAEGIEVFPLGQGFLSQGAGRQHRWTRARYDDRRLRRSSTLYDGSRP